MKTKPTSLLKPTNFCTRLSQIFKVNVRVLLIAYSTAVEAQSTLNQSFNDIIEANVIP